MPSQTRYAGSAVNYSISGSSASWQDLANITGNTQSTYGGWYATYGTMYSPGLRLYNYGFTIPDNAVITGIEVYTKVEATAASSIRLRQGSGQYYGIQIGNHHAGSGWAEKNRTTYFPAMPNAAFWGFGGAGDTWGLGYDISPSAINNAGFSVFVVLEKPITSNRTGRIYYCEVTVYYELNDPPAFSIGPTLEPASGTRYGPNNPLTLSFRATDDNTRTSNGLSWSLRSSSNPSSGTEYASGTATHNITRTVSNITSLPYGTTTMNTYLHITDEYGALTTVTLPVLRDNTTPAAPANLLILPNDPVEYGALWELRFTSTDTGSTAADELTWELWTGPNKTGTRLSHGTRTSSTLLADATFTGQVEDTGLVMGTNTRYLTVTDGAFNSRETPITVEYQPAQEFTETTTEAILYAFTDTGVEYTVTDDLGTALTLGSVITSTSFVVTDAFGPASIFVSTTGIGELDAIESGTYVVFVETGGTDTLVHDTEAPTLANYRPIPNPVVRST